MKRGIKVDIDIDFVNKSYNDENIVKGYLDKNNEYGLSIPEKKIISKYIKHNDSILDIGCGIGRASLGLWSSGYKNVTGIDISSKMIQEAERNNSNKNFGVIFEVQNVLKLPYNDHKFDSAVAMHSITPIPKSDNRKKALYEIKRVLKNNSILILSTFLRELREDDFWLKEEYSWCNNTQDRRLHDFGDILIDKDNVEIFIHIPSREEFVTSLEETGFEIIDEFLWSDFIHKDEKIGLAQKCKYWVAKVKK